jgi:glutathione synthase/RimK-type ligase-like ATP-grasp enzyme
MKLSDDKEMAYTMLALAGIPIPASVYVHREKLSGFQESTVAGLRYPMVLKPHDQAHGNGVMMNIASFPELLMKLKYSLEKYDTIIIQQQIF